MCILYYSIMYLFVMYVWWLHNVFSWFYVAKIYWLVKMKWKYASQTTSIRNTTTLDENTSQTLSTIIVSKNAALDLNVYVLDCSWSKYVLQRQNGGHFVTWKWAMIVANIANVKHTLSQFMVQFDYVDMSYMSSTSWFPMRQSLRTVMHVGLQYTTWRRRGYSSKCKLKISVNRAWFFRLGF